MTTRDELAAVVTLKDPVGGEWYGFIPHTQLFGSTAAALRYNCLSRVIASLACRISEIPRIGYYDDFRIVLPEGLITDALDIPTSFKKALMIILKENKSEYGALLEFSGLVISFRNGEGPILASLSLSQGKGQRLVNLIEELPRQH